MLEITENTWCKLYGWCVSFRNNYILASDQNYVFTLPKLGNPQGQRLWSLEIAAKSWTNPFGQESRGETKSLQWLHQNDSVVANWERDRSICLWFVLVRVSSTMYFRWRVADIGRNKRHYTPALLVSGNWVKRRHDEDHTKQTIRPVISTINQVTLICDHPVTPSTRNWPLQFNLQENPQIASGQSKQEDAPATEKMPNIRYTSW